MVEGGGGREKVKRQNAGRGAAEGQRRSKKNKAHHNWKLAACVESLKSIPMETVTEASGSSRSEEGGDE